MSIMIITIIYKTLIKCMDFPSGSDGKESACNAMRPGFSPWVEKIPWRREWLPTPLFLPEEFHGQRSLAGYSPWGPKELDTTEQLCAMIEDFPGGSGSK